MINCGNFVGWYFGKTMQFLRTDVWQFIYMIENQMNEIKTVLRQDGVICIDAIS